MDYDEAISHLMDKKDLSWNDAVSLLEVLDFAEKIVVEMGEKTITARKNSGDYEIG